MGISSQAMDHAALTQRREAAAVDGDSLWGLAFSGGGIRSATFCFGLLRGLARAESLRRFDYLSTVSGGGYIGAAFGRLFQGNKTPQEIEARLGSDDTLLLWWLRNNGRYLTPAGARDLGQALASIVRNTLFSHAEAGVLMLLAAGVMLLPYWLMALGHAGPAAQSEWPVDAWRTFGSAWSMNALRAAPTVTLGTLAGAVTAARLVLPRIQHWLEHATFKRLKLETLVHAAGLLLLFGVVLFWAVAFNLMVSPSLAWSWWPGDANSVMRWAVVMLACVAYLGATAKDIESLNLSSLHNFYRARIERAYVSTGNWRSEANPEGRFPAESPLTPASRQVISQVARLIEAVDGDDVLLSEYAPHRHGGPIHLITCSINQTVDDRTGMYNADRMGVALTVSSLGIETGTGGPVPFQDLDLNPKAGSAEAQVGKLSRWVAISGAAASSGMGSQTSVGLAALMFLSGLRLGYWTPKLLRNGQTRSVRKNWLPRMFPKQSLLIAELVARFPGLNSPSWYVSDGGHFENTAVYPLLKRKLGLIVLADCGADPGYRFEDLENLVRKAKIDYGASIEFLRADRFAANNELTAPLLKHDQQGVLLARITYFDAAPPGLLVIVKPRVYADVPFEVSGYAARHPAFPQEPTSDQFFAEEQWEAYHQLGLFAGQWLTLQALEALRGELANIAPAAVA